MLHLLALHALGVHSVVLLLQIFLNFLLLLYDFLFLLLYFFDSPGELANLKVLLRDLLVLFGQ